MFETLMIIWAVTTTLSIHLMVWIATGRICDAIFNRKYCKTPMYCYTTLLSHFQRKEDEEGKMLVEAIQKRISNVQ